MPVRFFYVDESYDKNKYCLSAISIRHSDWKECFEKVKQHRRNLKNDYGIFLSREIHAHELVAGRGRISPDIVTKWQRSRIFLGMLDLVASLPNVFIINICLDTDGFAETQMKTWDRLTNRVERTMLEFEKIESRIRRNLNAAASEHLSKDVADKIKQRLNIYKSRAVFLADEGREKDIIKAIRKMHVYNPIPSKIGDWGGGKTHKNITTDHLIEDPIFKPSHRSYFIQLADCVAFALLKREVPPTRNIKRYGINKMFEKALADVCFKKCSPKDPLGIVRA